MQKSADTILDGVVLPSLVEAEQVYRRVYVGHAGHCTAGQLGQVGTGGQSGQLGQVGIGQVGTGQGRALVTVIVL